MAFSKKLCLQYNGARYFGWQVQQDSLTIQGELNSVIKKVLNTDDIKSIGSGRTDRGVHARMQIVKVDLPKNVANDSLIRSLNCLLPNDIRILSIEDCSETFHPISDARSKEYCYYFTNQLNPFFYDLVTHIPFDVDLELIKAGLQHFVGTHDFKNFYCTGTDTSTTVRTIFNASLDEIRMQDGLGSDLSVCCVAIEGSGFLKQMVRQIIGALLNYGRGKVTERELLDAIDCKVIKKIGSTAAPNGLYLNRVSY